MDVYAPIGPAKNLSYTAHLLLLEGHPNILLRLGVSVVPLSFFGIPLQRLFVWSVRLDWSLILKQPLVSLHCSSVCLEKFLDFGLEVC